MRDPRPGDHLTMGDQHGDLRRPGLPRIAAPLASSAALESAPHKVRSHPQVQTGETVAIDPTSSRAGRQAGSSHLPGAARRRAHLLPS